MLAIDAEHGHVPAPLDDNFLRAYVEYLREGTDLQEHVSEVFARVAVTFMYEIKETGMALTSAKEFFKLISKDTSERTRKNSNISDFLIASETFSEDANLLFAEQTDALIKNVAKPITHHHILRRYLCFRTWLVLTHRLLHLIFQKHDQSMGMKIPFYVFSFGFYW